MAVALLWRCAGRDVPSCTHLSPQTCNRSGPREAAAPGGGHVQRGLTVEGALPSARVPGVGEPPPPIKSAVTLQELEETKSLRTTKGEAVFAQVKAAPGPGAHRAAPGSPLLPSGGAAAQLGFTLPCADRCSVWLLFY